MHFDFTPGMVLPALATPLALVLGCLTWRVRSLPGAIPFILIALLSSLWSAFNALELVTVDLQGKLLWNDLQYIAIALTPALWLIMALDYAGKRSWLTPWRLAAFLVVPVVTIALIWTNQYHHLMRTSAWLDANGSYPVLGRNLGAWFWVHTTYSYLVAIAAVATLVSAVRRVPPGFRNQPALLLAGLSIPLLWNMIYVLVPGVLPRHDFTPATFILSEVVVILGLLRFRLFSLVPVARHTLVETMSDGLLVLDETDRVVDFNEAARRLIGQPASKIYGHPLADIWEPWTRLAGVQGWGRNQTTSLGEKQATISLRHEGEEHDYEIGISPLTSRKHVIGHLLVLHDVTERSRMEESLRLQALTDALTGLPNRTLFLSRLDDAVRKVRRDPSSIFAVVVLDLDRFKLINDSIGHLAGDLLLQDVAAKLKRCVRDIDLVARMGGDEFMVLLHGISSVMDVLPVVERIQAELKLPFHLDQQEIASPASIGIAMWESKFGGPEDFLRAADTAMYQAKEMGGSCCRVFDDEMHESVIRALKAEVDLRSGIKREEFVLVYQPIMDLKTGSIQSLEALMRWRHHEHGTLLPGEFIKIAERSGLIVPLGELALEEVCGQLSRWRSPGSAVAHLPVRVNVSPRQLTESDFVDTMLARMAEWRIQPESILLELTETALIRDPFRSRQVMARLCEAGIGLCLDDFGTGWSSLGHLTTFPVQSLKIDRSFVSRVTQVNTEFQIVRAITDLAHSIGLEVTGEGVEHAEQLALLGELGCDHAQGYYIGRPMSASALSNYLEALRDGSRVLDVHAPEMAGDGRRGAATGPAGVPLTGPKRKFAPAG